MSVEAFSSMVEVCDGGWRAVRAITVCGCLLRSLLRPILSVSAGGNAECRGPTGRRSRNQCSCWIPSSRSARHSHSYGSWGFLQFSISQLDPHFPFCFHPVSNSVHQFRSSRSTVCLSSTFSAICILWCFAGSEGKTHRTFACLNLLPSLQPMMKWMNNMNNNYQASYCNDTHTHTPSHCACSCIVRSHNCPQLSSIVSEI